MELTLVTWNVKGHAKPDVAVVVDHARAVGADVLALQEVQRRQAGAIPRALGAASLVWSFKHWPVRWPSEGLAVIGLTQPVRARSHVLSFRFRPWSWRRRIFQVAVIDRGRPVVVANTHLSPYSQAELRGREAEAMLRTLSSAPGPVVVAGDLNARPEADMFDRFREAGLRDAWVESHPGDVPRPGDDGFARFAHLSDHCRSPQPCRSPTASSAPPAARRPPPAARRPPPGAGRARERPAHRPSVGGTLRPG